MNEKRDVFPDGHPKYPTCGHLSFPHLYFHLRGMKKEKDMVIQVRIRHTELKSESQGGVLLPGHRWGIFKWPSGVLEEMKKGWRFSRNKMIKESVGALVYLLVIYGLLLLIFILFLTDIINASTLLVSLIIWSVGHILMDIGDSIHTHTRLILKLLVEQNEILQSMKVDSNN